jgi:hypothetical protein
MHGGGCGCGASALMGGCGETPKMNGGRLPDTYPVNTLVGDPTSPNAVQNERLINGGKRESRRKLKTRRNRNGKKVRGGGWFPEIFGAASNNPVLSFATTGQSKADANTLMGLPNQDSSPYVQPIGTGTHNRLYI